MTNLIQAFSKLNWFICFPPYFLPSPSPPLSPLPPPLLFPPLPSPSLPSPSPLPSPSSLSSSLSSSLPLLSPSSLPSLLLFYRLTNEESRENWEKYGNPDGPQAATFGIALPAWIVDKQNSIWVCGRYC